MKEIQKKALINSIKHWEENLETAKREKLPYIDGEYCACCVEFTACEGCPIAEYAGDTGCSNTPYDRVLYFYHYQKIPDWLEFQKRVEEELEFLKKVLETDTKSIKDNRDS